MTETLCDSGAVKLKAGLYASTLTAAQYTTLINEAEAFLSTAAKYDWVDNYSSVDTNLKPLLSDAASCHAAIKVIQYNQGVFTSRQESQIMINVLWANLMEIVNRIRDDKFRTFVQRGTTD